MNDHTTAALQKEYIPGSQQWFLEDSGGQDRRLRRYGCGVIAFVDDSIYLGVTGRPEGRPDYLNCIRQAERFLRILPGFGISVYFYPFLANISFRRLHAPYRLRRMPMRRSHIVSLIKEQLRADLPLIFAVGTPLWPFGKGGVKLYRMQDGRLVDTGKRVKSHYMTIVALHREADAWYLKVASGGAFYEISLTEYLNFGRFVLPFSCVIYRTRVLKQGSKSII